MNNNRSLLVSSSGSVAGLGSEYNQPQTTTANILNTRQILRFTHTP